MGAVEVFSLCGCECEHLHLFDGEAAVLEPREYYSDELPLDPIRLDDDECLLNHLRIYRLPCDWYFSVHLYFLGSRFSLSAFFRHFEEQKFRTAPSFRM